MLGGAAIADHQEMQKSLGSPFDGSKLTSLQQQALNCFPQELPKGYLYVCFHTYSLPSRTATHLKKAVENMKSNHL